MASACVGSGCAFSNSVGLLIDLRFVMATTRRTVFTRRKHPSPLCHAGSPDASTIVSLCVVIASLHRWLAINLLFHPPPGAYVLQGSVSRFDTHGASAISDGLPRGRYADELSARIYPAAPDYPLAHPRFLHPHITRQS